MAVSLYHLCRVASGLEVLAVPLPEASGPACPRVKVVFGPAQRSRRLISAASVRLFTPSFRSRLVTWTLTVF